VDGMECEQERELHERVGGRTKHSTAKGSEWKTHLMLDSC